MTTSSSAYILDGSPSIVPLSRAIILLIHLPLVSTSERVVLFFITIASSRFTTIYSALTTRRPSSFFHPLNYPASTLSSRALNASATLSFSFSSCRPPTCPTLRSRTDATMESSFIPESLLFRDVSPSPLTTRSYFPVRRVPIFRNLASASLRNPQTPDAYQQQRRGRTKDEITSGPITRAVLVCIYNTSCRGLLSGESSDGNSIRTLCISF